MMKLDDCQAAFTVLPSDNNLGSPVDVATNCFVDLITTYCTVLGLATGSAEASSWSTLRTSDSSPTNMPLLLFNGTTSCKPNPADADDPIDETMLFKEGAMLTSEDDDVRPNHTARLLCLPREYHDV